MSERKYVRRRQLEQPLLSTDAPKSLPPLSSIFSGWSREGGKKTPMHASEDGGSGKRSWEGALVHTGRPSSFSFFSSCQFMKYAGQYPHLFPPTQPTLAEEIKSGLSLRPFSLSRFLRSILWWTRKGGGTLAKWTLLSSPPSHASTPPPPYKGDDVGPAILYKWLHISFLPPSFIARASQQPVSSPLSSSAPSSKEGGEDIDTGSAEDAREGERKRRHMLVRGSAGKTIGL